MSARTFAEALRVETATLQAQHPTRENEIARAHALIANGQVVPMEPGHARVLSSTNATVWYDVTAAACSCPDAQYRKVPCKHLSAWKLYQHIQHQVDTETPPAPLRLPPAPAVASPAPEPMTSDALFSITLKGLRCGQDALVTARGQTWEAFQENLAHIESLLDAPPPAPAQGQDQVETATATPPPVCKFHGAMKASTKAPGTYYCTKKLHDGSYCSERGGVSRD